MHNFFPKKIFYEKEILNYTKGNEILDKYSNVEKIQIDSHNNIDELRKYENKEFATLKSYLIIGIRKTLKFVPNSKVSDYLVSYTSSGCSAMCLYCYLVCNFNKCSYLRIFVNREQIMDKIIKKSRLSEKELVFEIGSNSDLILENTITNNLPWTIETFGSINKGYITFPTKFHMVDNLLNLNHNGRTIIRMSVNPQYIITNVEFKTSNLKSRVEAINKLVDSGYTVGIIVAPVILVEGYKDMYFELLDYLNNNLNEKAKSSVFFEVIFMTYSYVHDKINSEAFPNMINIYNKDTMSGNGKGKYRYKKKYIDEAKIYMENIINFFFKDNEIKYIV